VGRAGTAKRKNQADGTDGGGSGHHAKKEKIKKEQKKTK
jgi:hypothetical protein